MSGSQLFCPSSKLCVVNFAIFAWKPFNLLKGSVAYGNISNLETHFSVEYDNMSYNQVGNRNI